MTNPGILYRLIAISAAVVIAGMILSGPPGGYLVSLIHPQPQWIDAATFIEHYHSIQAFPFAGGFLLILGFTFFIAAASQLAVLPTQKVPATLAIIFAAAFAVMIGINYTLQLAWVPELVRQGDPDLSKITMQNPNSIGWVLEMFGYAFLGLSTWAIALVFWGSRMMNTIRYLLIANGFISIVGAILTTGGMNWLYETPGIISYVIWNLLIIVTMALIYFEFRKRRLRGGQ